FPPLLAAGPPAGDRPCPRRAAPTVRRRRLADGELALRAGGSTAARGGTVGRDPAGRRHPRSDRRADGARVGREPLPHPAAVRRGGGSGGGRSRLRSAPRSFGRRAVSQPPPANPVARRVSPPC